MGSGASGPKSALRDKESTTFAQECFSSPSFKKLLRIQQGILPFCPFNIRYTYKTKLKFEKFGFGGWCVASCTSIQCSKFTVQA